MKPDLRGMSLAGMSEFPVSLQHEQMMIEDGKSFRDCFRHYKTKNPCVIGKKATVKELRQLIKLGLHIQPFLEMRYRRRKTAQVCHYNPWNWDAEVGDLMVRQDGALFRLEESTGWYKSRRGELTPRRIQPPFHGMKAEIREINGVNEVFWIQPA